MSVIAVYNINFNINFPNSSWVGVTDQDILWVVRLSIDVCSEDELVYDKYELVYVCRR